MLKETAWQHGTNESSALNLCDVGHDDIEHNLDSRYDVVMGSIADSDISGQASHIEDGDLTFKDISVYDVLTDKGITLGLQISLHTMRSLSSVVSKSYEVIEGRNK